MRYREIIEAIEAKDSDDGAYLYHGTSKRFFDSIKHQGLVPRTRAILGRYGRSHVAHSLGRIFFTNTAENAEWYGMRRAGRGPRKILRVRRDFLPDVQPDSEDPGGFFIDRPVPPDQIEFWNGKTWADITTAIRHK